jgi:hemolysin activation/secretion protein
LRLTDAPPVKWFVSVDNTGNDQTGNWRTGVGLQHANVFGRDHVLTLNYVSSPGKWNDVEIMSAGYRVPLYRLGHSVDLILAKSNVNAGTTTTVAGPLTFAGKGEIAGVRYNWLLPRRGLYTHRVVFALDYKAFRNTCSLGVFGAAGCGSAGVDITDRPASVTYAAQSVKLDSVTDFAVSYSHNLPGTGKGESTDFVAARPSPAGLGGAPSGFEIMRATGSHARVLPGDFQFRIAGAAQYTKDALIPQEQVGIAGSTAVRGFLEREVARDVGYFVNAELYSPDLASAARAQGSLRVLAFYDRGAARNNPLPGEAGQAQIISSAGSGVRWNLDKKSTVRFDVARVIQGVATRPDGRWRGHAAFYYAF